MIIRELTEEIKALCAIAESVAKVPQLESSQYNSFPVSGFAVAGAILKNVMELCEMQHELIVVEHITTKTAEKLTKSGVPIGT